MKLYYKIILIGLLFSGCTNSSIQLPDEADWVYVNKEMFDRALGGYRGEYQIKIVDDIIYVKTLCTKQCDIVNLEGEFVDTAIYDSIPFGINMEYLGGEKMYVWDAWEFKVNYSDKSRIEKLKYVTKPKENLKLLSRRRPKREHCIDYVLDNKEYSVCLPSESGSDVVYNVCQYDETKFLFSMNIRVKDMKYGPTHYEYYCVVMIDLEDLSKKRFLGIKL
ncbi:MAG: hypothetical protein MI866_17155 [Bacteroidales bacterium]|nr:hypothetical protein [Bacteroidales bacterium]